jgi:hypothetical protein
VPPARTTAFNRRGSAEQVLALPLHQPGEGGQEERSPDVEVRHGNRGASCGLTSSPGAAGCAIRLRTALSVNMTTCCPGLGVAIRRQIPEPPRRVPGPRYLFLVVNVNGGASGISHRRPALRDVKRGSGLLAAHHGRPTAYVRNLAANPRVRIKVRCTWRTGNATVMPNDNTR